MTDEQNQALEEAYALLREWAQALDQVIAIKSLIENEILLRRRVFRVFFPIPKEGTNKAGLANGYILKAQYKLSRKLDESVIPSVATGLREMGVDPGAYLEVYHSLKVAAFKELREVNPEAFALLSEAVTTKEQSPTLEIVPPKKKAQEQV